MILAPSATNRFAQLVILSNVLCVHQEHYGRQHPAMRDSDLQHYISGRYFPLQKITFFEQKLIASIS